ncbi:hypothetical protein DPMN_063968 [Dreissena polymorpha]|uniref:Uncharacterized protein n=1 Tax=Dreissena polymorpha TaxID=45954 RepID=A0A9D4HKR4_DREPO|nr:hypothetical protein DPMN_063968 [Dreissena polymorpha]
MADKCPHWDFHLFQFAINPDTNRKNNSQFIAPPGALPCAMAPRRMRRTEQLLQRRSKPERPVLQAQLETSLLFVQEYSVPGSASAAICAHTDKASPRPKDDLSGPSRVDGRTNE